MLDGRLCCVYVHIFFLMCIKFFVRKVRAFTGIGDAETTCASSCSLFRRKCFALTAVAGLMCARWPRVAVCLYLTHSFISLRGPHATDFHKAGVNRGGRARANSRSFRVGRCRRTAVVVRTYLHYTSNLDVCCILFVDGLHHWMRLLYYVYPDSRYHFYYHYRSG